MLISSKLLEIHSFGTDFFFLRPLYSNYGALGKPNSLLPARPDSAVPSNGHGVSMCCGDDNRQEGSQPRRLQARLSGVRNLLMGLMSRGLPGIFA